MNALDIAVLVIFALFILEGIYKGFLSTVLSIGAFIVSWALAMAFMPLAANAVKGNESLYNMMLYYTEGSEYIGDTELAHTTISAMSSEEIDGIITGADLPFVINNLVCIYYKNVFIFNQMG